MLPLDSITFATTGQGRLRLTRIGPGRVRIETLDDVACVAPPQHRTVRDLEGCMALVEELAQRLGLDDRVGSLELARAITNLTRAA